MSNEVHPTTVEGYMNEWYNKGYTGSYISNVVPLLSENRVTDPETGGQKGKKREEYALIPAWPLGEIARVYGDGALKYEPWNWGRGYAWSLSFSALQRHIEAFRSGESINPDSGLHHLAHAAFHLNTLMEFDRLGLGTDDRWKE